MPTSFPYQAWGANLSSVERHVKACGGKTPPGEVPKICSGHACQIGAVTDETYARKLDCVRKLHNTRVRLNDACNLII